MKVHVLPGDATAAEFRLANVDGDVIVCRECLIAGDVDADSLPEFWDQRARFILSAFGEDVIEYHEKVADDLARLIDLPKGAEVNLWFEYELFCSVNFWFCLYLLQDTGAEIYRVEPLVRTWEDRWKGFGALGAEDLGSCFEGRKKLTSEDVALGANLWNAYRHNDHKHLREISKTNPANFPYLNEICEAAINKEERPIEILREIRADGFKTFPEIFPEFVSRAGEYGFGDVQIRNMLDKLT
ncbi:MAG: DUF1835 domain-containing protein [Pyrinomonadaceae bacterium]